MASPGVRSHGVAAKSSEEKAGRRRRRRRRRRKRRERELGLQEEEEAGARGGVSRARGRRNKVGRKITILPFPSLFHLFDRSYLAPLV